MAQTVFGFFENETAAQRAVEQLESAGISRSRIDVARKGASAQGTAAEDEGGNAVTRFFKNLFGDDNDDAGRYANVGNSGRYSIVTVHAQSGDEAERAADLLDEAGSINVDEQEAYQATQTDGTDSNRNSDATISRVQEELQVGKREVETGGVRLRSRIVERPVEETLRLREEHVSVERNPVNRPLTAGDSAAFQDQDIELTERAEVPVVSKEARVVEEIRLSKDVNERTETVRDTVRNTEVDIDDINAGKGQRSDGTNRSSL